MSDRYTFVSLLSKKPGIATWLAFDEITRQTCIAKAVNVNSKVHLHQLKTEIQLLSKLKGDDFALLLDVVSEKDQLILFESQIEGITLDEWLKQKPTRAQKRQIFLQIVKRIQKVHEAGYVYMDLKPDNILIDGTKAWLIDFNGALPIGSRQILLANVDSIPPESVKGQIMTEQADQIGLGRLYQKMFGPSWISWKCLQKKQENRFQDLDHLIKAMHPIVPVRYVFTAAAVGTLLLVNAIQPLHSTSSDDFMIQNPQTLAGLLSKEETSLYSLALSERLDPALYENLESLQMMALQVVEDQDALMAHHILEKMSVKQQEDLYYLALPLRQISGDVLSQKELNAMLIKLAGSTVPDASLQIVLGMLYGQGILLEDTTDLEKILKNVGKWELNSASGVLEYAALLKSQGHILTLPSLLEDFLQSNTQTASLLQMYKRSN